MPVIAPPSAQNPLGFRSAQRRRQAASRKFHKETGTLPLRWLTSQRMAGACRLLETTDLTVQAVAAKTGLGTPANFRLHFTRELNTTPSSYRRLYQGRNRSAIALRSS
ncbi:helix-turn-helix domain-containing protein [Arthrobacter sp. MSA 4-2]|uniref:helix-turn-helix domain-containing protein n=1 Tax=Arthrobacter sp. MSA 4-2 TaxID=2794349 RepID=UPI0022B841D8|nr:helix-turn-helix domain-containing protein [Arthrobacter sp. MSA 4-2]